MLSSLGYTVTACSSSEEAKTLAKEKNVDLMLVDLFLPRISGSELVNELRQQNSNLKVLFMTGTAPNLVKTNEINDHVLFKPFDLKTLADAVKSALNKDQSQGI